MPDKKKTFVVYVPEVWIQPVEVEAESPEQAQRLVQEDKGRDIEGELSFAYVLDPQDDSWRIEEKSEESSKDKLPG